MDDDTNLFNRMYVISSHADSKNFECLYKLHITYERTHKISNMNFEVKCTILVGRSKL